MSADKLRSLGWSPKIGLEEGVRGAYEAFLKGQYLERSQGDAA